MTVYIFSIFVGILGFVVSSTTELFSQFNFYRVKHAIINELISSQDEQIAARSVLDCSRACAASDRCLSIVFNSEDSYCFLLPRGVHQNLSNPELTEGINIYTRTNRRCSEIGYQDLNASESCFKVFTAPETQLDAMSVCTHDGGYLVQLRTSEKHKIVQDFIKGMSVFGFYIDGSDVLQEDDWRLSDGSTFYITWSSGEPSEEYKMSEQCLLLYPNGLYNDMNCSWPFPFICEREAMPYM